MKILRDIIYLCWKIFILLKVFILSQPVCLSRYSEKVELKEPCLVSGWGSTGEVIQSDNLKVADVYESNFSNCSKIYERNGHELDRKSHFCAKNDHNIDVACRGDSGGPLVCFQKEMSSATSRAYLEGIAIFGGECGGSEFPGNHQSFSKKIL